MSFTKRLKSSLQFFKKRNISFLIIRRYDLGLSEESLHYIAVKPYASISELRHKVWHLLDLPDFCEEIILLRNHQGELVSLTELTKGNLPENPFVMEVHPPEKLCATSTYVFKTSNAITLGSDAHGFDTSEAPTVVGEQQRTIEDNIVEKHPQETNTNLFGFGDNKKIGTDYYPFDYKNSELTCKMSTSTILRMNRNKAPDNLTNALLQMQRDLKFLSDKLTKMEGKIQVAR